MKTLSQTTIKQFQAYFENNTSALCLIYGIMQESNGNFTYFEAVQEWAEDKAPESAEIANILLSDPAYLNDACDLLCLDSAFSDF